MAKQYESSCPPPVSITKTVSVYPKILHPQKEFVNLSNLDRQCPILMYLVLFYNPTPASKSLSFESVFDSLKSGLEETLSIWYPAAGRLSLNTSPEDHGKLDIWCNNKGALLVQAMSPIAISDLGDLSQYNQFFEKLIFKPDFGGDFTHMPLVVGQVTKFGCGGYSVGIGTSHSVFDGPAAYEFLSAWACASAIMKPNKTSILPQLYKPVHDRPPLLLGNGTKSQFQNVFANNNMSKTTTTGAAAIDHLYHLIMQRAAAEGSLLKNPGPSSSSSSPNINNYVLKTFHLSTNLIQNLKMQVFNQNGGFSCSSFEVVAAHLWKARSKALGLRKEAMACLQFAVDTRNKVVPPLPNAFSGNAYVLASVALAASELELVSHKTIIEKIRKAKNSVNNDYVKAYMQGLEGPQGSVPPLKELTIVSDWTRMPFHKIDLLHGEAAYASPLLTPMPQVAYFMQNPNDTKGINVRIGLLPQYVDAFSRYFFTVGSI